jgi:hypothetical protein
LWTDTACVVPDAIKAERATFMQFKHVDDLNCFLTVSN